MSLSFYNISKEQTGIIKGIGIIIIVLHNYLHRINITGENEVEFDLDYVLFFLTESLKNPSMIPNYSFSFLGHFGVQLFVLISAYGLTKINFDKNNLNYKEFAIPRITKMYKLLIFGILFYFILFFNECLNLAFVKKALSTLSMLNNISGERIWGLVGPWWFFSLIIQFYLIFPFLLRFIQKYGQRGLILLMAISYVLIYALYPITVKYGIVLYGNFLGHLPEFLFGMALAAYPNIKINYKTLLGALVIFILSNFSVYAFHLGFLSASILLLYFCYIVYTYCPKIILKWISFVGGISMFIFIANGPLRRITRGIFGNTNSDPGPETLLISLVHLTGVIVISYILSLIYNAIDKQLVKILPQKLWK